MASLNRTLNRQIQKFLGGKTAIPSKWKPLLQAISLTYIHFDEDRALMERSLELSSKELNEINKEIEKKVLIRTKELRQERARLTASISSFPLGILLVDLDNNIILRNEYVSSILGIANKNYTFVEATNRFPAETEIAKSCQLCVTKKKSIELKDVLVGNKFARVLLSPIFMNQQEKSDVIGYVFLIEDITQRKLFERSKDTFVAITAHELRTPLTIIRGNAELLLLLLAKEPVMKEARRMLLAIQESCIRLLGIVNDFLDIKILEGKRIQLKKEIFDVTESIREVLEELKEKALAKNLPVIFENQAVSSSVFADRDKTKEIIMNLVTNAIQYTEKGEIRIIVEQMEKFIKISVADTGIGIESELQSSLFQKFNTVRKRFVQSKEYGSGMGLYISKLLTESMGGKVHLLKSVSGVGSTFEVLLPCFTQNSE